MINIKYKTREDKIGEVVLNKHGTPMKIVEYRNSLDCDVEFQDDYKYIFEHAVYQNFLKGQIRNPYDKTVCGIGMIGVGKYKTRQSKTLMSKYYNIWQNILERCYVDNNKHPAYYNTAIVCEEWHNFQNFAQWYDDNSYELPDGERLEIDKDILVLGNKTYAPEVCILVPQRINLVFTNMARNDGLPNGIQLTANGEKFQAMYNKEHLGCFGTLEKAYKAYADKKEEAIKQKADEYKDYLPQKVYDALYKYKVKIEYDKNYINNEEEN